MLGAVVALAGCRGHHRSRPLGGDAAAALVVVSEAASGPAWQTEREPDDAPGSAQTIVLQPLGPHSLQGGVRGSIAPPTPTSLPAGPKAAMPPPEDTADVDVYRVDVPPAGPAVLRAELRGAAGVDLSLELLDGGGGRLVRVDDAGVGEGEILPDYTLEPGPAYLRVAEVPHRVRPKKGQAPPPERTAAAPYTLTVTLSAPLAGREVEPNDDPDHALDIALGDERHGMLGWRDDRDVYRVALTGLAPGGSLRADLDGVDGVAADLSLLGDGGQRLAETRGAPGESLSLRHVGIPPGTRQVFAVVEARGRGNPTDLYAVRVSAEEAEGPSEIEPNDTPAQATRLEGDAGTVLGNVAPGDKDCFALTPAGAWSLALELRPPGGQVLALELVDAQGRTLERAAGNAPGQGISLRATGTGTAFVRVTLLRGGPESADLPYRLSWTASPAAVPPAP